jgi:hypothetical protein
MRGMGAMAVIVAPVLTHCFGDGGLPATEWTGPPFSAEIVPQKEPAKPPARIYVGEGRIRLEMGDPLDRAAIVFDPARRTTLIISLKDRSYIDAGMFTSLLARGTVPLMRFLHPMHADDPCIDWNSTVENVSMWPVGVAVHAHSSDSTPHLVCHHQGSESVNGRPAQKWTVAEKGASDSGTVWIDDRLHLIVKSTSHSGGVELHDIQEGPQPAALFEPPAGYRRLGFSEIFAKLRHTTAAN